MSFEERSRHEDLMNLDSISVPLMAGKMKLSRLIALERAMGLLGGDVAALTAVAASHGTKLRELATVTARGVSQSEFLAAMASTRFQTLKSANSAATASNSQNTAQIGLSMLEVEKIKSTLASMEHDLSVSSARYISEIHRLEMALSTSRSEVTTLAATVAALTARCEAATAAAEAAGILAESASQQADNAMMLADKHSPAETRVVQSSAATLDQSVKEAIKDAVAAAMKDVLPFMTDNIVKSVTAQATEAATAAPRSFVSATKPNELHVIASPQSTDLGFSIITPNMGTNNSVRPSAPTVPAGWGAESVTVPALPGSVSGFSRPVSALSALEGELEPPLLMAPDMPATGPVSQQSSREMSKGDNSDQVSLDLPEESSDPKTHTKTSLEAEKKTHGILVNSPQRTSSRSNNGVSSPSRNSRQCSQRGVRWAANDNITSQNNNKVDSSRSPGRYATDEEILDKNGRIISQGKLKHNVVPKKLSSLLVGASVVSANRFEFDIRPEQIDVKIRRPDGSPPRAEVSPSTSIKKRAMTPTTGPRVVPNSVQVSSLYGDVTRVIKQMDASSGPEVVDGINFSPYYTPQWRVSNQSVTVSPQINEALNMESAFSQDDFDTNTTMHRYRARVLSAKHDKELGEGHPARDVEMEAALKAVGREKQQLAETMFSENSKYNRFIGSLDEYQSTDSQGGDVSHATNSRAIISRGRMSCHPTDRNRKEELYDSSSLASSRSLEDYRAWCRLFVSQTRTVRGVEAAAASIANVAITAASNRLESVAFDQFVSNLDNRLDTVHQLLQVAVDAASAAGIDNTRSPPALCSKPESVAVSSDQNVASNSSNQINTSRVHPVISSRDTLIIEETPSAAHSTRPIYEQQIVGHHSKELEGPTDLSITHDSLDDFSLASGQPDTITTVPDVQRNENPLKVTVKRREQMTTGNVIFENTLGNETSQPTHENVAAAIVGPSLHGSTVAQVVAAVYGAEVARHAGPTSAEFSAAMLGLERMIYAEMDRRFTELRVSLSNRLAEFDVSMKQRIDALVSDNSNWQNEQSEKLRHLTNNVEWNALQIRQLAESVAVGDDVRANLQVLVDQHDASLQAIRHERETSLEDNLARETQILKQMDGLLVEVHTMKGEIRSIQDSAIFNQKWEFRTGPGLEDSPVGALSSLSSLTSDIISLSERMTAAEDAIGAVRTHVRRVELVKLLGANDQNDDSCPPVVPSYTDTIDTFESDTVATLVNVIAQNETTIASLADEVNALRSTNIPPVLSTTTSASTKPSSVSPRSSAALSASKAVRRSTPATTTSASTPTTNNNIVSTGRKNSLPRVAIAPLTFGGPSSYRAGDALRAVNARLHFEGSCEGSIGGDESMDSIVRRLPSHNGPAPPLRTVSTAHSALRPTAPPRSSTSHRRVPMNSNIAVNNSGNTRGFDKKLRSANIVANVNIDDAELLADVPFTPGICDSSSRALVIPAVAMEHIDVAEAVHTKAMIGSLLEGSGELQPLTAESDAICDPL